MIELANWVAGQPTPMPAYNAVAGFGMNPYDPRTDPRPQPMMDARLDSRRIQFRRRNRGQFVAANVGSDTGGSIISPANQAMLVGLRPTIAASAATELFPSRRITIPRSMTRTFPTPRFCSAFSKAPSPIRRIRPRRSAPRLPLTTIRNSSSPER